MKRTAVVVLLLVVGAPACAQDEPPQGRAASQGPVSSRTSTPTPTSQVPSLTPTRPTSPADAARKLDSAMSVITAADSTAGELELAGHQEQLAIRETSLHPRWLPRVLRRLPGRWRRDVRDNVASRLQFRSMHPSSPGALADELPAWRIVAPPPAAVLKRHYREAERRYGVDWEFLAAIHLVETAYGRIRGTSVAGAQGPMQFIPTTWDIYGNGGDINDPHDAILAAGRLLRANGFSRDKAAALYRYNNSSAYVRGVSLHAQVMQRHPRAFLGYHAWQVYYLTQRGSVWLEEGYAARRPVPVDRYLEQHPEALP